MIALAIGNGESRKGIDLNSFSHDVLVGCNAIHRDIDVEHLVCCDRRMIEESLQSNKTKNTKIYVRSDYLDFYQKKDSRIHSVPNLPYKSNSKADMPIHWGSGPYAVLVAAELPVSKILLLGFDLYPKNNYFNNIYKDTQHYKSKDSKPIDYSYWEYQIAKVFTGYSNKKFIVLNKEDWKMPTLWNLPNVEFEVLATKNLTFA